MGKMMSPTAIFYMIVIGCVILYMVNQLIFYGKDMQTYYIYTAFFTFILFSTAILDLQEPSLELEIGAASYENIK